MYQNVHNYPPGTGTASTNSFPVTITVQGFSGTQYRYVVDNYPNYGNRSIDREPYDFPDLHAGRKWTKQDHAPDFAVKVRRSRRPVRPRRAPPQPPVWAALMRAFAHR